VRDVWSGRDTLGGVISASLDEGDARGWRVAFAVLIPAGYSCKTQQHLLSCFAAERLIKTWGGALRAAFAYPITARKQHLEGAGVFEIHIEPNGSVGSVTILKTTGHTILDAAAITGFRQWRFRPHTIDIVRVPVQYRITLSSVRWGSRSRLKNIGDGDAVVIMAGNAWADKHVAPSWPIGGANER
jgi:TonB family protein